MSPPSRIVRTAAVVAAALVSALLCLVVSAAPASATVFSSAGGITVADGKHCLNCVDPGTGNPYPSTIAVSGMTGTVTDVNVTLKNVSHAFPGDFDVLLVGPSGQSYVLVSDAGSTQTSNATVTFDDSAGAALSLSGPWSSGTYRPSNLSSQADVWPSPAPAGPHGNAQGVPATLNETYNGVDPNGSWQLYVTDDALGDTGTFAGGWSLDITTANLSPTTTSLTSSSNPSTTGQGVTFTAAVSAGGSPVSSGTVTFTAGPTLLATVPVNGAGQAAFSTSSLAEGTHAITARYNGDGTRAPSSSTLQQTVDTATTKVGDAFCNTGGLAVKDGSGGPGSARPYPSLITTGGLPGVVDSVALKLDGVSHQHADDLDVLLVGPGGHELVVVSDAGGAASLSSVSTTFRDGAPSAFGTSGGWGASSRPVNHGAADGFPAPAPPAPYNEPAPVGAATFDSVFDGANPNGAWRLYVVDDALGGEGSISGGWCLEITTVLVNGTPVADAGGPYSVAEGEALALDGSASSDPDGEALGYTWDVDGDGTFGDATGATPQLSWSELEGLGLGDGDVTFDVGVRVLDASATDTDQATATVTNAAPSVTGPEAVDAAHGVPFDLALTATDPSTADDTAGLAWSVDWGDGSTGSTLQHTWSEVGTYTVEASAVDKDGGTSPAHTVLVTVSGTDTDPNPCGQGTELVVAGTSAGETINVKQRTDGALVVRVDGGAPQVHSAIAQLTVHGAGGHDTVTIDPSVTTRPFLYGGTGHDTLTGGRKADVLVGGDGDDLLLGGKGRDMAIGGQGADKVKGAGGSDLLADGTTSYDAGTEDGALAFCAMRRTWDTKASYASRVKGLSASGGGASLVPGTSVFADRSADGLTGGTGTDWFLLNAKGPGARDVSDRKDAETATDL